MSIIPGNYITNAKPADFSTQGYFSSHHQVSKAEQDDFEKSLDDTHWNEKNSALFNRGLADLGFHQANATSRHYVDEHKKIMDELTDAGKSKSRHHQG